MHGKLLELISAEAASASVARSAIAPGSANRWSAVGTCASSQRAARVAAFFAATLSGFSSSGG